MYKRIRLLLACLLLFSFASVTFAKDAAPAAKVAAEPAAEQMHQAPFIKPATNSDEAARNLIGGGGNGGNQGKQKGDEGLKQLDLHFDKFPQPSLISRLVINIALGVAGFLINVLIVIGIIVLIRRALRNKIKTGSFIPEDSLLYAAFDVAKIKLDARHKALEKELRQIQKRKGVKAPVAKKKKIT